ncbi:MAG: ribosome silencing factor [Clostridia bacterium]|nr:ribosome silencing factor [Clostridia bacterium]
MTEQTNEQVLDLVTAVVQSLDEHKAEDIRVLKVDEITSLADYFILATGTSTTHVQALVDYLDTDLSKREIKPLRTEGYQSSLWTVLDYGAVVIHVFAQNTRQFYDLERLWQDAQTVPTASFLEDEKA